MKHLYQSLALILSLTVFAACVTTRKKDEAKGFKLFMHNLTAKYNGYFNANVLVLEATEKLVAQHQDNYNQILDIYPELAVDNPTAVSPDLDKAIEKVAVVATYHRPSHWVDDCYLMMGKAQYYKHDFESAEETFAYLAENYSPTTKRKLSKKEREKIAAEAREDKKKERDQKAKEAKKEREEANKLKEKEREDRAKEKKQAAEQKEEDRKKTIADAAKMRKSEQENKKLSLEERNKQRQKENEERTEQRRKEREEKERLAKQGSMPNPVAKTNPSVKENKKQEIVKTGSNATPLMKPKEDGEKVSKIKKPSTKPDKYILKHRPCYQEGAVWYARTLVERQNYVDAEVLLNELDKNPKTFKDIRRISAIARAHLYLQQKMYDAAIPALENGVKLTKKKREKARLNYILAQLYQRAGNSERAFASFDKVLGSNPVYEMEFNARLNMALNSNKSVEQSAESLIKMSKDFKNRDYGDQIYFTLAQIALKNNDKPKAIGYLKDATSSQGNGRSGSKAEAYYLLAKLNFEVDAFVEAKNYYDSASTTLNKTDRRQEEAANLAANLMDIARHIQNIQLQDSLIKLSALSDKERRDMAARIKKEQLKKLATPSVSTGGKASELDLGEMAKKSKFFAYNGDLVKRGKREFDKKWGTDRKNEDDWRRSNKRSSSAFAQQGATATASDELTEKEFQEMMKDVPRTPKQAEEAQAKIEESLFQLGTLYQDKLKNSKKSIGSLDEMFSRFPKTKNELAGWYYLYLAHSDLANPRKAQEYYDKVFEKYSGSSYAEALKGSKRGGKEEDTVEKYYATTYALFKEGKYKEAQDHIKESDTKYGISNALKAKFALLNAMCIGHELGRINYIAELKGVMSNYPETPEQRRAAEILRILEFGVPVTESPKTTTEEDAEMRFAVGEDKLHYVLVILDKNVNIEDAKVIASDFNSKYFRTENLNISNIQFDANEGNPVLVMRKFKDKATALKYTEGVARNKGDYLQGVYEVFAVSQDNYRELIRQKGIEAYRKFYDKNYQN